MSATSLLTIAALLVVAFALWFIVYRVIWSPFSVLFSLKEGGAEDEAAGYNSYAERVTVIIFTDVYITIGFIWGLLIDIYYTVRDNPQVFIGSFLIMGGSIVVATFDSEILEAIDVVWHDVVFPAYDDVIRPLLVAFQEIYDVLIPWYNLIVAAVPDTIIFTVELFVECDLATWQESIDTFARIIVVIAQELRVWTVKVVNNRGASFNFFIVIKSITAFLETLLDKLGCLCYELNWLWCTLFDIVNSDNLAISIDQLLNFFLCFLDIIIDWIINLITVNFNNNPIPNFKPAFDKLCNSTNAFSEWIVDVAQIVVQEFITDEGVVPDFGCLLGGSLCSLVRTAQAIFDLLSNEFDILKDIKKGKDIRFLLQDFEYDEVFGELLGVGQCLADITEFYNVTALNFVGCTLQNLVNFATFVLKLPADWIFELFAIGPTCFQSISGCADDYLDFVQQYNFTPIFDSARNASFCFFGVLGLLNKDFACAGDNLTNAVLTAVNISVELLLNPELVFTSASFWRTLPFNDIFFFTENFFVCLGGVFKSFASDPSGCPPHVVDFDDSGGDDDDSEQVNFWCCTGNTISGLGKSVVALAQTLFDVLLDLIEDRTGEEIAQDAFDTFSFVVVPQLEIGLDNLACIPLSIFEDLGCPSGGFQNFDDDDDDAHTQVGEALEAWTITFINITLIPAKLIEVTLGAFLAGYVADGGGDDSCDSDCQDMLNEVVCPSIDLQSSTQGLQGCILTGFADALFRPFVSYLQGVGAMGGCFFGVTVQNFFRGASDVLNSLINAFDSHVLPIFKCTYMFWADIFAGDFEGVAEQVFKCYITIDTLYVDIIVNAFTQFPERFLKSLEQIVCKIPGISAVCDLRSVGYATEEDLIFIEPYIQKYDWSGNTRCDRLVQSYQRYVELGLENVARAEIGHCIILRSLAVGANQFSPWYPTPVVDEDVLYNPVRIIEFLYDLPKGLRKIGDWIQSGKYMQVHEEVWKDSWNNGSSPHIEAEIKDLDHFLIQQGVKSRGVITFINGISEVMNRMTNLAIYMRSPNKEKGQRLFDRHRERLLQESSARMQKEALNHNSRRAVQRQKRFAESRIDFRATTVQLAASITGNITEALRPKTPHAIARRAQAARFFTRLKQAYQVSFIDRYPVRPRRVLRDSCKFPGDSCKDSAECCTGLVCIEHSGAGGKVCSTDLCATLFDDSDNGDRFDCEDICENNCTGCNWLQDVFCKVYLDRFSEVLFRVSEGLVPCFNVTNPKATPTPTPTPIVTKIPPNSFTWQVFTWVTRNIFGISNSRLIDIINDVGNFITNTNVDPDDGDVGLAGIVIGFFFCEYDELSACNGPGIERGLEIITPIYLLATILMSFVFPGSSWILDAVWMTYIPVLLVVSYEVGFFCYLRTLPFPNLPENLADDLLSFADSVFTPFINWNNFLPGLLVVSSSGQRSFKSCSNDVGFVNWSDNLVFLLQWLLPAVTAFLRDTDLFLFRWIRELPFIGDSLNKPQLDFSGSPPDEVKSCFIYTSLNWFGLFFVLAIVSLFVVFAVLLSYLLVITILAILTWIAYLGIETARKTHTARKT